MSQSITRRAVIVGGMGLAVLPASAWAQEAELLPESPLPPVPADLVSRAEQSAYRAQLTSAGVGAGKPNPSEIDRAREILLTAPSSTTPLKVAQYLFDVGQSGGSDAAFLREWPVRANPLIQTLFMATDTKPYGDITPWCGAFVNWCIARAAAQRKEAGVSQTEKFTAAELAPTSKSAASGSFRCWTVSSTPLSGDLVVFRELGSTQRCTGKGHVAFLLEELANSDLRILGGNQILKGTSGAVTISRYPRSGGEHGRLRFFGYRSPSAGPV